MHDHNHEALDYNRAFAIGIALNAAYIVLEAGAGFWVGSLALLADAAHNLSDVLGLLLAWGAHALSRVGPSSRRTYGWRGSSILAAVANGLLLLVVTGGIAWEAIQRFGQQTSIVGWPVIIVAAVGVLINGVTAGLFYQGCKHDLNIRGAFLHMAADALVSLGVVVSGVMILLWNWLWIDPIVSLVIAGVIFWSTWGLLRESVDLALHAVPRDINIDDVRSFLEELPGVAVVHDLHVWGMSTTEAALTAHLIKPSIEDEDVFLFDTTHELKKRFGIDHVTLQIERNAETPICQHADACSI